MAENSRLQIAVFDVDRTLVHDISAEELLIHHFIDQGIWTRRQVLLSLKKMISKLPRGWERAVHFKSWYLRGLPAGVLEEALPDFCDRILLPRLSPHLMAFMPYLKSAGYAIYLVSGTLGPIVDRLVESLGVDGGKGSVLNTDASGCFTGEIAYPHPYHHGKPLALDALLQGRPVDWQRSFAFGDSWADIPLMSRFGMPVVVNPGIIMGLRNRWLKWPVLLEPVLKPAQALDIDWLRKMLDDSQKGK